jgi:hypothetical protein
MYVYMYVYVVLKYPVDVTNEKYTNHVSTVLLEIYIWEDEKWFKEMDYS